MQMNAKFGELACTKICNEGHMWVLMYVCFKEIVGLTNMVYWSLYVEFNFKRNSRRKSIFDHELTRKVLNSKVFNNHRFSVVGINKQLTNSKYDKFPSKSVFDVFWLNYSIKIGLAVATNKYTRSHRSEIYFNLVFYPLCYFPLRDQKFMSKIIKSLYAKQVTCALECFQIKTHGVK